jgi:hypothetical protein
MSYVDKQQQALSDKDLEAVSGGGIRLPLRRTKSEADLTRVKPLVSTSPLNYERMGSSPPGRVSPSEMLEIYGPGGRSMPVVPINSPPRRVASPR